MILIKPSFEILDVVDGSQILRNIEKYGRTCYKSEDKMTDESAPKFVKMIRDSGHESVLEHEKVTVRVICDRGVSHEIVRHRIASYSQESTRYYDYNKGHITFIIPPWVTIEPGQYLGKAEQCKDPVDLAWFYSLLEAESVYSFLRNSGWKPEQARSVLPNSLKTEIVITYNLREWRHFFKLRTSKKAHPQMREISIPMLKKFQDLVPIVFNDIDL